FAESGVHYAAALLAAGADTTLSGNPWDNATMFQGIAVPHAGNSPFSGRFSIVSLRSPEDTASGATGYRFGVTDEAGKINLNALLALARQTRRGGTTVALTVTGSGRSTTTTTTPGSGSGSTAASPPSSPSKQILMGLESLGMTEEIANSILNWMDPSGN